MVFRGGGVKGRCLEEREGELMVFRGKRGGKDRVQKREWEKVCCLEGEGKEERMVLS